MPILRLEVCHFIALSTSAESDANLNALTMSPARPDQLYKGRNSGKRLSFRHNLDLLRQLATHLCGFDYDACLTPETTAVFFFQYTLREVNEEGSELSRTGCHM